MSVKKRSRKSRVSKGIHGTTRSCAKASGMQRLLNQLDAHQKGKKTRVTISTKHSNAAFVVVDGSFVFDTRGSAK